MSYLKKLFNRKRLSRDLEKLEEEAFLEAEETSFQETTFLEKDISFLEKKDEEATGRETEMAFSEADEPEEYEIVEREILPVKIICPDCGGITLEGLEFCDKCGGELQ